MATKFDNRMKVKTWRNGGTFEYDGGIAEGVYYTCWGLTVSERDALIQRLTEQQAKAKETEAAA